MKCLATRFDTAENKDAQGRKWSEVHVAKEKTKWCRGTIQSLVGGRRFAGNYKVKHDGDSAALTSNEACPLSFLSLSFPFFPFLSLPSFLPSSGKNFYKEVKRPRVLQHCYAACGGIDVHNNFRQGQLRLEKFHQTRKWNARVFTSVLSSTMVDACRAREHHFPTGELGGAPDDLESGLKSFVAN